MRLLFLAFDSVLHPYTPYAKGANFCWLPMLEKLLKNHEDVRIIVHSIWRYEYCDCEPRGLFGRLGERFVGQCAAWTARAGDPIGAQKNKEFVKSHLVLDYALDEFNEGVLDVMFLDGLIGISDLRAQAGLAG